MEDGPRYHTIRLDIDDPEAELRRTLRPGDRVVAIIPATERVETPFKGTRLGIRALLELRHPSWAKEGVGWVAGGEDPAL